MFQRRKKLKATNVLLVKQLREASQLSTRLQRQMASAGEMRFPDLNAQYQAGWMDCLRYLNIPIQEDKGKIRNMPATRARQSSTTHRTDRE